MEKHSYEGLMPAYHFQVSFLDEGGQEDIPFRDVSGFDSELQVDEVASGGENGITYRLPKSVRYGNLKLSRALRSDHVDSITQWAEKAIQDFDITFKTVLVSVFNEEHQAVRTWRFTDAYPVKLNVSELNATKNELVIETLELAFKFVRRDL
jgi:phage tail-like protein